MIRITPRRNRRNILGFDQLVGVYIMVEPDKGKTIHPVLKEFAQQLILGLEIIAVGCKQKREAEFGHGIVEGLNKLRENRKVHGGNHKANGGAAPSVHRLRRPIADIAGLADGILDPLAGFRTDEIGMVKRTRNRRRGHTRNLGDGDNINLIGLFYNHNIAISGRFMKTFAILFSWLTVGCKQQNRAGNDMRPEIRNEPNPVDHLIEQARIAQANYETAGSQARFDRAAQAAAWAIMQPERNRALAELAVQSTGLGNVADKITKNHRKTLGLMRDIKNAHTFGILSDDPETGIIEIARPIGVIGAVVPSTNPAATPANNIINALKCGNAIIVSPSPKGVACCALLLDYIHAEFDKIGEDKRLVQMIPPPGTKTDTQRLLECADLAVVTGSQDNVRRAYSSGTPAIGVGAGNVTVIVDETADLAAAAKKITLSKTFDNATSCSSENAIVVVEAIFDRFIDALAAEGGAYLPPAAASGIVEKLWPEGHLNREVIARDADVMIEKLDLSGKVPTGTKFVAVETAGIGNSHPLSGEKLSRVAALYRARDYDDAVRITRRIMAHQGAGHSLGIHTARADRPVALGMSLPTCRVIVNQAHTFATGGSFENGLPFSLSMGCGSWGGNSIDDNLHWRHFMQRTKIIRPIPPREPALEDIFGNYWAEVGQ